MAPRRRERKAQAPLKAIRLRVQELTAAALRFEPAFRLLATFARVRHR
jgi:hypothetical protein